MQRSEPKEQVTKRQRRLEAFAREIEEQLPASERWFREFWLSNGLLDDEDRFNEPFGKRIPDLVNHKFKYVIEIDGAIHNSPRQMRIDASKDRFYDSKGYSVLRVRAFNMSDLLGCVEVVERLRFSLARPKILIRTHD